MSPGNYAPLAATDAFFVGPHNIFERNGVILNDLSLMETYVVEEFSGFERPDGQPNNEANTSIHGESFIPTLWGGRTMSLSGYVRAGTYTTAMIMGEALRASLATRMEMPLKIKTAPGSVLTHETYSISCQPADFTIDPKAVQSDRSGHFRRAFSVSLRASYPFYERDVVLRSQVNWTGQPYMAKRQLFDVSAGMGVTANGPGTVPTLNIPGYRVACTPTSSTLRIAGPYSTSPDDWMRVEPGEQIFGSVVAQAVTASADLAMNTELVWRNAAGSIISSTASSSVAMASAGTYTATVTGVAPAGAAYASRTAHVRRQGTSPTDVWFTNMWTGIGTSWAYGAYRDGSYGGWEWDGVAGQSFSRPVSSTSFELTPTTVSIPGRPYDRVYDLGYNELMDMNGSLVTSGPNVIDVLHTGSGDARMTIKMQGMMEGIVLVNETTKQSMYFTDIAAGDTVMVDAYTGQVFDQNGIDRPSLIDPRSDYIHLAGKRDGSTGNNRFVLYVQDYDAGAKFTASYRKTHF